MRKKSFSKLLPACLALLILMFVFCSKDILPRGELRVINALSGNGIEIKTFDLYHHRNLHEFVDGEADLILEYDFLMLSVLTCVYDSSACEIELYRMRKPLDAQGLFSARNHDAPIDDRFGNRCTIGERRVEFVRGNFVAVVAAEDSLEKIARIVDVALLESTREARLPGFLRDKDVLQGTIAIAKGKLSMRVLNMPFDENEIPGKWEAVIRFDIKHAGDTLRVLTVSYKEIADSERVIEFFKGWLDTVSSPDLSNARVVKANHNIILVAPADSASVQRVVSICTQ